MRMSKCLMVVTITLLVSACSGQGHDALPASPEANPAPASGSLALGLADPGSLLASLPPRSSSAGVYLHTGSDFELAGRATAQGSDVLFEPQWSGNTPPFGDAAYAIYRFNEEGFSGQQTFKLTWTTPPSDYDTLWLGLSSWSVFGYGRWEWRRGLSYDFLDFGPDGQPYANGTTGDVLLAIVVLGTTSASLSQVELGGTLLGDWSMGGHDAQRSGLSPHSGPKTGHLKWALNLGGDVRANPVIAADGTIYIGTFHTDEPSDFFAVNPDGTVKWSMQTEDSFYNAAAIAPDGTIYVATGTALPGIGVRGSLYALNPDSTIIWTAPFGTRASLLVDHNGTIYIVVEYFSSGHLTSSLYAVNPDGTVKWKFEGIDRLEQPALSANGDIYLGSRDGLYALNSDGTQQWLSAFGASSGPVVSKYGSIYSANSSQLSAIDASGVLQWTYDDVTISTSSVAIGPDGTLYLSNGTGGLHALSPEGIQKWSFPWVGWSARTKPAVGADGTIYVAYYRSAGNPWNGALLAFKPNGTLLWVFGAVEELRSPSIGNDGTLYVGSSDDYLYAIGP